MLSGYKSKKVATMTKKVFFPKTPLKPLKESSPPNSYLEMGDVEIYMNLELLDEIEKEIGNIPLADWKIINKDGKSMLEIFYL